MKMLIKFEIECGETSCASIRGNFCKFLRTRRFGTECVCHLFSEYDDSALEMKDGWTQRHDKCLSQQLSTP